jgi:hypothetical protein
VSKYFTKRGQKAAAIAAGKSRQRVQAGQGRISQSLGSGDPRHRRNDQSAQATERRFHPDFFYIDNEGRLRPRS